MPSASASAAASCACTTPRAPGARQTWLPPSWRQHERAQRAGPERLLRAGSMTTTTEALPAYLVRAADPGLRNEALHALVHELVGDGDAGLMVEDFDFNEDA